MKNYKISKIGKGFSKEIEIIRKERWGGMDKDLSKPISTEKLTEGIIKFPEWENIKLKLIKEPRKDQLRRL